MKLIITGSLGHISKPLARELVQNGHSVTVISSNPAKQTEIEAIGAKAAVGSIEDQDFLAKIFAGSNAVYTMMPPFKFEENPNLDAREEARRLTGNYVAAIQRSGVKRVVHLSSIGAHTNKGNGLLHFHTQITSYNWAIVILLGFEVLYITMQAARGQLSHYNISSPLYTVLTAAMALAAIAATLYTGYIGILFCTESFPDLPDYYLWAIRISIFLFVIFAFEGAAMGANGSHTVGGTSDGDGLPLLNRSRKYGDLRIAHFAGMHALQLLPLIAFYLLKDVRLVCIAGFMYGLLALLILIQALNGKSLLSSF